MTPGHFILDASKDILNNQTVPVLFYRRASKDIDLAAYFEETFQANGWSGTWRDGVFDYHHFHSNAHEVLGIAGGYAELQIGGPEGDIFPVCAGDVIVLPAGTGHRKYRADADFVVIGAYPSGQEHYDVCRDGGHDPALLDRIKHVAIPNSDPLEGRCGSLCRLWK